ncbi:putative disease resistance protein RGA1 [Zingiber officinale]|uniref:Uncharacterized protein n=1 Tax=Zingiber officinale TaxID=94328 RepID=A0A8J5KSA4_ZINOF|nr:putative disease resistance protein RGA1 [Zingiber officinale]KAG6498188.1 hypothetical protein ZIOFF_046100 [Zingiber officinale]
MEAALVTATVRFMGEKVANLLELDKKLKVIIGVKGKMKKLKELSTIIDTVIEDVESHPLIDVAVRNLLRKIEFLANDIEDVVDCYDTEALRKQRSSDFFRPVRDFFSSNNQVVFNCRIDGMIKAITDSLDSILLQKSFLLNLPQSSIHISELSFHRETHSRNSLVVLGRETEKQIIVNMLTDDESNHDTLKVIAIVGMGGLGKTTLAQLVFNDEEVKAYFDSSRMWKVVGDEFNPTTIMKSVLELATGAPVVISEIDLVRRNLEKALSGKKFLLVLDDVWNEDPFEWGKLKAVLTCGSRGSKILVTTRNQQVSSIMDSSYSHQMMQLSPADCWFLFQKFAFGDKEVDQILMEIGGKIVEKCGGVPLAVISLGSMLRITRDETYWSSVLNSEIWQLGNEQVKVLAVLKLSYDTLPPRSKKCFAFASLFSKNYRMSKDELIKLWISNGFVRSEGNFDAETLGNHVFDDLVMRSFFLLVPSQDVTKCTMHDLMHDLARSVSADVYCNFYQDSMEDIGKRTYHLKIGKGKLPNMKQVLGKKPLYLRTFIFRNRFSRFSYINLHEVFSELKFLRALDLTNMGIREVPTSIGNLIHLRYLNLSRNHIEVLPDSIILLSNLQYLNLSFNEELQELPKELGNMQNLRSLPFFVAGDRIGACSILELENLKLHGEMKIIFSKNFTNYSCGGRKILKNKDLNELCINFNGSERYDKDMLDDLCPNTSLKKLGIWYYGSPQFPAWLIELQLPNLVEVHFCCSCEHIPPFGNLQFLKKLELWFMNDITHLGVEFHGYGGFPSLQELRLSWMDNLEEWSELHGVDELFPKLQSLTIFCCPKLKSMPRLIPRIQHLKISYCSDNILSCIGRLTSLSFLEVAEMNDMASIPSGCIRNLTSLTKLIITKCRQLQSFPWDEMQHLKMIHSLTIENCDNLASFPSEVGCLIGSLYFLRLTRCPCIILQPEELIQILNSVHEFQIEICGNKVNLRGQLQYLHTLKELSLWGAHAYIITYGIAKLSICCCDELELLMTAEQANSIVLDKLYIEGISNLTTLPDWLQHLKSLRLLSIQNCPQLERMPRDLKNLCMLETLKVFNCPQLKRRCERETGEDWPVISHISYIDIL